MRQTIIAATITTWVVVIGAATYFVLQPSTPRLVKVLLLGFLN